MSSVLAQADDSTFVGDSDLGEMFLKYRFGRWGSDGVGTSSNFQVLSNLVDSLEEMNERSELLGVEVFLVTDNATAEAAFSRGSSSSMLLYGLVKRMKLLEMCCRARMHVIHVAGTRMMAQGTDGLSRGCLLEGVMQGTSILSFIPLHQTALERSPNLLMWLQEAHSKADPGSSGCLLRQLWEFSRKLSSVPEHGMVSGMLQGSYDSKVSKTTARKRQRIGVA